MNTQQKESPVKSAKLMVDSKNIPPISSPFPEYFKHMIDPIDRSSFMDLNGDSIRFSGGKNYPVFEGIPILISNDHSIFSTDDIINKKPTTQIPKYRTKKSLKNYVRQNLLPTLTGDEHIRTRYKSLGKKTVDGPILIVGAGDKAEYYRTCFPGREVVISDVHCLFYVDLVFDAHNIPFADSVFSLVLLPQVLEHTAYPWKVAEELQRITKKDGLIQIEVPFSFPFHGEPYDFYRFTPTALSFLFPKCKILNFLTPEGNWSGAATTVSNAMIDTFKNRYLRMFALGMSRFLLWWMKYMDRIIGRKTFSSPKGFVVTYQMDGVKRSEKELLENLENIF